MKKFLSDNKLYFKSIILVFGINALLYFLIKLFINNYNLIGTNIDKDIPFIPGFIYIYMIWYPFLMLSFYYIYSKNKSKFKRLIVATVISLMISYVIFIIYPTIVERPEIQVKSFTTWFVNFIYECDYPVNCFPSVHCLMCFLLMLAIYKEQSLNKLFKIVCNIMCILIVLSTLFVKQHVVLDAACALIISVMIYNITPKIQKYIKKS